MSIPIISVVMSVYNGEKYLAEAIDSILTQTYINFELIIINDGSKDRTLEIIEKYINKDERIVLISRENKGLIASLNEGIEKAKGKYIARMDADDICISSRFEEQITFMQENNIDLCGSWIAPFNEHGKIVIWKYPKNHNDIVFRSFFMSSFAHPSVMIKKDIFKELKYENEVAEDYRLWCDIMVADYKVGNVQKVLLKYRIHGNQITETKSKELKASANKIALNFANQMDEKLSYLVTQAIENQINSSYKNFDKILQKLLVLSKKYNINQNNLYFIFKTLYDSASPKTPLIYFAYRKATKGMKKDNKEELQLFLKSLVIVKRESKLYQGLKKIRDMVKK